MINMWVLLSNWSSSDFNDSKDFAVLESGIRFNNVKKLDGVSDGRAGGLGSKIYLYFVRFVLNVIGS